MIDEDAFAAFVTAHQSALRAYVASFGVPWDAIDEIAQEAFVQFYLGDDRRPRHVEPLVWLKSIARHGSLSWFRRQRRADRWMRLADVVESVADHDTGGDDADAIAALRTCLTTLPDQGRQLIEWFYRDETSAEEIARRLRQNASAVRMRLMRVRNLLRDCVCRRLHGGASPEAIQ